MATNDKMKLVVTKIGLTKIMEATISNPLKLTHFAVGDGNGSSIEPNENMTSLVNEKYRDFLNGSYANGNNLSIECVLRANAPITQGFKIFELGIFDADGDMIVISQTPEQYRPSNTEGVATEWIASVVLNLSNTDNISIEIPETVFATVDALQRLIDTANGLITSRNNFINSCVGVEKHFNTSNEYKDQDLLTIGVKTYGLAGSIVKIADYPIAFKNCGAVDRGDGTFEIPKFYDGTIRHLEKGNSRALGSYEADDLKSHAHDMSHDHDMGHQHNVPHDHGWHGIYSSNQGKNGVWESTSG